MNTITKTIKLEYFYSTMNKRGMPRYLEQQYNMMRYVLVTRMPVLAPPLYQSFK